MALAVFRLHRLTAQGEGGLTAAVASNITPFGPPTWQTKR